jgi:hypothetical protein
MRFRSIDGEWVVDIIRLRRTGDHGDGECFRVTRYGFFLRSRRWTSSASTSTRQSWKK